LDDSQKEQYAFEDSVRATARLLWNEAALDGAGKLDERERDGIFETRDTIHIVEATTSTKLDKALSDAKKTHDAVLKLRKAHAKFAQGWVVTRSDPTADQLDQVKKKYSSTTTILSFEQFRSRLFNGSEYIRARSAYRFGSIQDFSDGTVNVPENEYVPTDFINYDRTKTIPHDVVLNLHKNQERRLFLILGEYGSGKSMALRAVFISRRKAYFNHNLYRSPIYLNLRDHNGQTSPVEALERHARIIGYPGPANDLVRAWRAGFVDLILDGFDEMATAGWGGSISRVRNHRYAGMALIRHFVLETPASADIYIAGRENFFDSASEMVSTLGISRAFSIIRTSEFSSDDLKKFLEKKSFSGSFPKWLPARPLLISYLLSKGLLGDDDGGSESIDEAEGWNHLLDMIAGREASQDARLEPSQVRELLERLATLARATVDGFGNLDVTVIQQAFQATAGFAPDEGSAQLLLRLPGLAPSSREDGTRRFVDQSLANAAKAGDVYRFVQHPYGDAVDLFSGAVSGIGDLGKSVLARLLESVNVTGSQIVRAIESASSSNDSQQICCELVYAFTKLGATSDLSTTVTINSVTEDNLYLSDGDASLRGFKFVGSLFNNIDIEEGYKSADLPSLEDCIVGTLSGIVSRTALPPQFVRTEVTDLADEVTTNAQLFAASLPEPQKVLVSVLRKLFLQGGAGRQESAFYRGAMDARSRALVPEVLEKIARFGFARRSRSRGKWIWHADWSFSSEARRIIFNPANAEHPLVKAVLSL